jgi:hypothetical protein
MIEHLLGRLRISALGGEKKNWLIEPYHVIFVWPHFYVSTFKERSTKRLIRRMARNSMKANPERAASRLPLAPQQAPNV